MAGASAMKSFAPVTAGGTGSTWTIRLWQYSWLRRVGSIAVSGRTQTPPPPASSVLSIDFPPRYFSSEFIFQTSVLSSLVRQNPVNEVEKRSRQQSRQQDSSAGRR